MLTLALLAQSAPIYTALPPYDGVAGPRELCTESFSVRLEAGETLAWERWHAAPGSTGPIRYLIMYRGVTIQARPWEGTEPAPNFHPVSLRNSRVTEERIDDIRTWPDAQAQGASYDGPSFRIVYRLHGERRRGAPLTISWYTSDRTYVTPVARRFRPGTMAERHCSVPAWRDPALTGAIGEVWPFGRTPQR